MKLKKAQDLLSIDITTLTDEKLQEYKVKLIDAWRYAKGDYGCYNDFFIAVPEVKAYIPKDKWLLKNINDRLELLGL